MVVRHGKLRMSSFFCLPSQIHTECQTRGAASTMGSLSAERDWMWIVSIIIDILLQLRRAQFL